MTEALLELGFVPLSHSILSLFHLLFTCIRTRSFTHSLVHEPHSLSPCMMQHQPTLHTLTLSSQLRKTSPLLPHSISEQWLHSYTTAGISEIPYILACQKTHLASWFAILTRENSRSSISPHLHICFKTLAMPLRKTSTSTHKREHTLIMRTRHPTASTRTVHHT